MSTIETLSIVVGIYFVAFLAHRADKSLRSADAARAEQSAGRPWAPPVRATKR